MAAVDQAGALLARRRISDDLAGFTELTGLLAELAGEAFTDVDVAIETDRGLLVAALRAAGHRVSSSRMAFGFHSAEAIIALAMLSLGGHRPTLPTR